MWTLWVRTSASHFLKWIMAPLSSILVSSLFELDYFWHWMNVFLSFAHAAPFTDPLHFLRPDWWRAVHSLKPHTDPSRRLFPLGCLETINCADISSVKSKPEKVTMEIKGKKRKEPRCHVTDRGEMLIYINRLKCYQRQKAGCVVPVESYSIPCFWPYKGKSRQKQHNKISRGSPYVKGLALDFLGCFHWVWTSWTCTAKWCLKSHLGDCLVSAAQPHIPSHLSV